jgi:hypothetical protein
MMQKMEVGDLVRFKHDDYKNNNLGIIIKVIKRPFENKYNVRWADPDAFADAWSIKHGWTSVGWFSSYDLEVVKKI